MRNSDFKWLGAWNSNTLNTLHEQYSLHAQRTHQQIIEKLSDAANKRYHYKKKILAILELSTRLGSGISCGFPY